MSSLAETRREARAERALRVLYVHHAGAFGGASRSLIELVSAFPEGAVIPCAVVARGPAAQYFRQAGMEVVEASGISQFDCTRYGYYRGARWLILLRECYYLPITVLALRAARRRWGHVDLVHLNDTTLVPCLMLARALYRVPVIVHARALLAGCLAPRRSRWLGCMLRSRCTTVVAIDEGVRSSLPRGVASIVIRNGFAQGLEAGAPQIPGGPTSRGIFRAAMVGSLSAMKGVYEFIEAARMLSQKGLDIEYLLVGDEIRPLAGPRGWLLRALNFARPVRRELEARIAAFGLQDRVRLLGFTVEIRAIYDAIDVLCFPSHLDAPGRPVFEAAFCGVPSIVAMTKSYPDTFVAGETGLQIPPRDPAALAHAIETLFRDAALRQRMGEQARALAMRNFDIRSNASDMLALYRQVAARSEPWNEA